MRIARLIPACQHFPNYFCLVCFLILASPLSLADIYISEVLYDPFTSESGGEAVELYNSGNEVIDLSGYTLATASSNKDAIFPDNSLIPSKGYFLMTDSNWQDRKDDILYPKADYEEPITMKNSDSGVALKDKQGTIIDAVGWGTPVNSSLYQGNTANYSQNGESLRRISFSGNNNDDFISSIPMLVNSRGEKEDISNTAINININIPDLSDYIKNISLSYDLDRKIMLNPGESKTINVSFLVNKAINLTDVYLILNNTHYNSEIHTTYLDYHGYSAKLIIDHYYPPGNNTLYIVVNTTSNQYIKNISFEVLPLLAFEVDLSTINCSNIDNNTCLINGDLDTLTNDKPTIRNLGNKAIDFNIYADNFSSNSNIIDINNLKFSFDNTPDFIASNQPTFYNTNLLPGYYSTLPLSLRIDIPLNAKSGSYSTRLILMAISNET